MQCCLKSWLSSLFCLYSVRKWVPSYSTLYPALKLESERQSFVPVDPPSWGRSIMIWFPLVSKGRRHCTNCLRFAWFQKGSSVSVLHSSMPAYSRYPLVLLINISEGLGKLWLCPFGPRLADWDSLSLRKIGQRMEALWVLFNFTSFETC